MGKLRKVVFWSHLAVGLVAGLIVLLLSVTGMLMAFERQILAAADGFKVEMPADAEGFAGPEKLLAGFVGSETVPSGVIFDREADRAVVLQFGRDKTEFLNPHTGESLGQGNKRVREFFRSVVGVHRWLGQEGEAQKAGRTIIGVGNLMFLFLLVSGIFLWFPKRWTKKGVKAVTLLQGRLKGRAREWNWHNVFGFWAAIPLVVIVACGTVISWPWATALVYHLAGEQPPAPSQRKAAAAKVPLPDLAGLDAALEKVKAANPEWRTIQLQLPHGETAGFAVADSHRGRPDKKRQVTVNLASGEIVKSVGFEAMTPARKARVWMRWIHTGEAGGIGGQSIAALAAASSVVLVWTGFALSWRRFMSRRKRVAAAVG